MSKKATKNANNNDFESSVKELEKIINNMESGKLSLEDSLKSFEQGIALTNHCRSLLSNAEQKVQILMQEQEEQFEDFELESDIDYDDEEYEED